MQFIFVLLMVVVLLVVEEAAAAQNLSWQPNHSSFQRNSSHCQRPAPALVSLSPASRFHAVRLPRVSSSMSDVQSNGTTASRATVQSDTVTRQGFWERMTASKDVWSGVQRALSEHATCCGHAPRERSIPASLPGSRDRASSKTEMGKLKAPGMCASAKSLASRTSVEIICVHADLHRQCEYSCQRRLEIRT